MKTTGVSNTIKEFSEDYDSLYNSWKYKVEQGEAGIVITHMEKEDDKWNEIESIEIPFACAIPMFKEITECLENGIFEYK